MVNDINLTTPNSKPNFKVFKDVSGTIIQICPLSLLGRILIMVLAHVWMGKIDSTK